MEVNIHILKEYDERALFPSGVILVLGSVR
jgi:hypothetical protein